MNTIFPIQTTDRAKIQWEDYLLTPTPVELVDGMWFKREDYFAPLGYGSINGTKLRQCIWLINEYAVKAGKKGVINGAIIASPQHPKVAAICKHYSIPAVHVTGTDIIDGNRTLEIARSFGAEFISSQVGYAKTLEAKVFDLAAHDYEGYFPLETNITVSERRNKSDKIEAFHEVGSHQVKNIPDHIETIICPAGSCNSVTSMLYGLARFPHKNLKKIILLGIGNYGSKEPKYIESRLERIGLVAGIDMDSIFSWPWKKYEDSLFGVTETNYTIEHYDVNGGCDQRCRLCHEGYVEYKDLMPYTWGGIEFHSRYEGKCFQFMEDHPETFDKYLNEKTMFWIVGGEENRI